MADDDKQSGSNLTSAGFILIALVLIGTYFFHKEPPLVSSRPPIIEEGAPEQAGAQQHKISARLWQDPLAAVAKALGKFGKLILEQQCLKKPSDESVCKSPLAENDKDTLVLGVTVSGAPYQEDAEHRRRTRYAVQAGLARAGFAPRDARHIDFFLWDQNGQSRALTPVALDIPAELWPLLSWWKPTLNGSSESIALQLLPVMPPLLLANQDKSNHDEIATIAQAQQIVVPYEWFEKIPEHLRILVLWLSEDDLRDHPLQKILELKAFLQGDEIQLDPTIKIIGPNGKYPVDIANHMMYDCLIVERRPTWQAKNSIFATLFSTMTTRRASTWKPCFGRTVPSVRIAA